MALAEKNFAHPSGRFIRQSLPRLTKDLTRMEGKRRQIYSDTEGHDTVGIGRKVANGFRDDEIALMLRNDILEAARGAERVYEGGGYGKFQRLPCRAREVLIRMVFQMGANGVSKFKKMLAHIAFGSPETYNLAAKEALNSKWARQTPARAKYEAKQLRICARERNMSRRRLTIAAPKPKPKLKRRRTS